MKIDIQTDYREEKLRNVLDEITEEFDAMLDDHMQRLHDEYKEYVDKKLIPYIPDYYKRKQIVEQFIGDLDD